MLGGLVDHKFYFLDNCPYCNGGLKEAGYNKSGNKIVQCIKCRRIILEKDISDIRREQDDSKMGK